MKTWLLCAVALLTAASAPAQVPGAPALTLDECLRAALGRSPELEAQRYELSASKDAIWKAQSALFPQLTGDLLTQTLNGSSTSPFNVLSLADADVGSTGRAGQRRVRANFDSVGAFSVRLSYGLFENGSIMGLNDAPAVAAARMARTRQEWTYRLSEQDVEYRLTLAFYQAVSDQSQFDMAKRKVLLSKERLEIIKQELQVELKLPKDVDLAQAQLAADQQATVSWQNHTWESLARLNALIGRSQAPSTRLDLSEPRTPSVPDLQALIGTAIRSHPAVGVQKAKIDTAREDLRLARSQMLPSVKLESGFTEATDYQRANTDLFVIGVSVNVPIFDFGHGKAATSESKNKMLAEQARLGQVEDNVRDALISAVGALHRTESKLADLLRDSIAAKNKQTLAETQRELGMIDQLALVDAQLESLTVMQSLDLQKLAQRFEFAALQYATGDLWKWQR